jgi:hypothetical protein
MRSNEPPSLDEYVEISGLLATVAQTFPTEDSLKWFIRRHRNALVDAGALIIITGRMRFHRARFMEAAIEIGQRTAGKTSGEI